MVAGFSYAQTGNVKEILFNKLIEKYRDTKEMSAVLEMNMSMMGTIMKMPMKIWMKGDKFRLDASMSIPGMDKPVNQITLTDGNSVIVYSDLNNTIMTADLTKLPEEARKMALKQSSGNAMVFDVELFNKVKDVLKVEESTRNGKKVYLLVLDNIDAIRSSFSVPAGSQMPFKKMVYIIDSITLLPLRMEIYGDAETPGLWMDVIEVNFSGVSDDIFKVSFPKDAKKVDMTDSLKGMISK